MDLDKPIFLIGAGRSGSTLVHKILSEHPEVAWLTGISNKFPGHPSLGNLLMHVVGLPAIGQTLRQLAPPGEGYVFWEHHCRGFRRPMRDLSAADVTPRARQQVRAAFDTIRTERRRRLVLKITGWPRIGFLRKIFEQAKFVHIVREGHAVVNSTISTDFWDGWQGPPNWRWGELSPEHQAAWEKHDRSFVALAGIGWRIILDAVDASDRVPARGVRALRSTRLPAVRAGTFRLPRWAA